MSDLVGTPRQVANKLETCEQKIWELIDAGLLPHVRLGPRKTVIVWAELERWLADETRSATVINGLRAAKGDAA